MAWKSAQIATSDVVGRLLIVGDIRDYKGKRLLHVFGCFIGLCSKQEMIGQPRIPKDSVPVSADRISLEPYTWGVVKVIILLLLPVWYGPYEMGYLKPVHFLTPFYMAVTNKTDEWKGSPSCKILVAPSQREFGGNILMAKSLAVKLGRACRDAHEMQIRMCSTPWWLLCVLPILYRLASQQGQPFQEVHACGRANGWHC